MSEYHLKMIVSANNGPRKEIAIQDGQVLTLGPSLQVFSALYGDGRERYSDVTKTVQNFGDTWPENWSEILYATKIPRTISIANSAASVVGQVRNVGDFAGVLDVQDDKSMSLKIHTARYGIHEFDPAKWIDVTAKLRSLVTDDSLDIVVSNSTLNAGNPFRGQRKTLWLAYSYDNGEAITVTRQEKEALIIGRPQERGSFNIGEPIYINRDEPVIKTEDIPADGRSHVITVSNPSSEPDLTPRLTKQSFTVSDHPPRTPTALNDFLIRRFNISAYRLRGPMPIELRDFHRNDLAQLFAELGFKRGAEIGVAEGNYSEILLKANPDCELLLVDPWHAYSDNPQNKSKEKHEYAYNQVVQKTFEYPGARIDMRYSMDAVRDVGQSSLDFCYIDGHHSFDYVMQDLIEWSKRVRSGGIISGDDLIRLDEKRWGAGPIEAVQAYVNAHRIPIWWTFAGHKSWDFMFVKP